MCIAGIGVQRAYYILYSYKHVKNVYNIRYVQQCTDKHLFYLQVPRGGGVKTPPETFPDFF